MSILTRTQPTNSQAPKHSARLPGWHKVLLSQLRYDLLGQLRNPSAMFFTAALPLVFLLVFSVSQDSATEAAAYFVPAMMILAGASGTLTNIAVTLAYLREYGQLKRVLVTPAPASAFLGSRLIAASLASAASILVLGAVGAIAFDATPDNWATLAVALILTLLVGNAIGLAAAALIRSETAGAPVANALALPMLLASGAFFPLDSTPDWFQRVADPLPFTSLVTLATDAYDGGSSDALLLAIGTTAGWVALSLAIVWKFFSWAPIRRR